MRGFGLTISALTLIVLILIPVGGSPPTLQKGSQADYDLSVEISFSPPVCQMGSSTAQGSIYCPMIASLPMTVSITGTLGWTATRVDSTTANLNVTRDLTISSGDLMTIPAYHRSGSFNESIDLATRLVTIAPFFMPEIDQAVQMAETSMGTALPDGPTWSSTLNAMSSGEPSHVYTMWWVNGPVKEDQTIPVIVFPTNVTGSTTVDLGSLGTHSAWALTFRRGPYVEPQMAGSATSPVSLDNNQIVLTFNYDKNSELLLRASADVHFGYTLTIPSPCDAPSMCSAYTAPIVRSFSYDLHATLKLASLANLSLDEPVGSTGSSSGGTTDSGSASGTGSGTGSDSGSGSGTGSGYGQGAGSGIDTGTGSGSGNAPQGTSSAPGPGTPAWIYWLIGVVAAAIIASGLLVAIKRSKKTELPSVSSEPIS